MASTAAVHVALAIAAVRSARRRHIHVGGLTYGPGEQERIREAPEKPGLERQVRGRDRCRRSGASGGNVRSLHSHTQTAAAQTKRTDSSVLVLFQGAGAAPGLYVPDTGVKSFGRPRAATPLRGFRWMRAHAPPHSIRPPS